MHVMLDLETLDTQPTAAIIAIGAVKFDLEKPNYTGDKFYAVVDINSNIGLFRSISGDTLKWWMTQGDDAKKLFAEDHTIPLSEALSKLSLFMEDVYGVWGNGATFDNMIIRNAYRDCGLETPWRYTQDMCYRTMKAMFPEVPKPEFKGVKHNALDDATHQAIHLQHIIKHMKANVQ